MCMPKHHYCRVPRRLHKPPADSAVSPALRRPQLPCRRAAGQIPVRAGDEAPASGRCAGLPPPLLRPRCSPDWQRTGVGAPSLQARTTAAPTPSEDVTVALEEQSDASLRRLPRALAEARLPTHPRRVGPPGSGSAALSCCVARWDARRRSRGSWRSPWGLSWPPWSPQRRPAPPASPPSQPWTV